MEKFSDTLMDKLVRLKKDDYIANEQSSVLKNKNESLQPGEVIIICDFAQNYSFVLQDAAQGFHWNNTQATVHTFVIYYKNDSELTRLNFVVFSDALSHNTVAVHAFQRSLCQFLRDRRSQFDHVTMAFF